MKSNSSDAPMDFYEMLGVEKTASEQQIKISYRKLALKYHPDRNPGDEEAQEMFKKVSIAYSVLSDPNKRRQYDISGPTMSMTEFEAVDITELGGVRKFFGAMFTKLGIPIATQIVPKVLAQARDLCVKNPEATVLAKLLEPGVVISETVNNQEAQFYLVKMEDKFATNGVVIRCRSSSNSKFKLVIFDKEGGVRYIRESQKKKTDTCAELFFVPFQRIDIGEFLPIKHIMEDKETPQEFHYLDLLQTIGAHTLESRDHYVCVYGDNFFSNVKYKIAFLPLNDEKGCLDSVEKITKVEPILTKKKTEMAAFQTEYMNLKRQWEEAKAKLKAEDKEITELLKERNEAYEELFESCATPFRPLAVANTNGQKSQGSGFFSSLFGGK